MLGYIHTCMEAMVIKEKGMDAYKELLKKAGFEEDITWNAKDGYPDELTFRLFHALAGLLKLSAEDAFEKFGEWMVDYSLSNQFESLMRCLADNLHDFLDNLSPMHYFIDKIAFRNELQGPSFRCEPNPDGSLRLHYYTERKAMFSMVKGLLRRAAFKLFGLTVEVVVIERSQEKKSNILTEHVVFNVLSEQSLIRPSMPQLLALGKRPQNYRSLISLDDLCDLYPCHICFTKQLIIEHCGRFLYNEFKLANRRMVKISDIFVLVSPEDLTLSFKNIMNYLNTPFVFRAKNPIKRNENQNHKALTLKGQMMMVGNGEYMLFMGTPFLTTVSELASSNMYISDYPLHDSTRDLIMLNQTRLSQQELNRKLEEQAENLKSMASELDEKKKRTDHLLFECLPPTVAEQLRKNHHVEPQVFADASCLQCDLPYFRIIMDKLAPHELLDLMNDLFHAYERLIDLHNCVKVLSFMDSYFVVAGVPVSTTDHADRILNLALGMVHDSRRITVPHIDRPVLIRVGVHSGSVVGGIIGISKIRYAVLSETVNIAKRLSQYGQPGKILVTNAAKTIASRSKTSKFVFTPNSYFQIGANQATLTFFLERNTAKTIKDLTGHEDDQRIQLASAEQKNMEVTRAWATLQTGGDMPNGTSKGPQAWKRLANKWGLQSESLDLGYSAANVSSLCRIQ